MTRFVRRYLMVSWVVGCLGAAAACSYQNLDYLSRELDKSEGDAGSCSDSEGGGDGNASAAAGTHNAGAAGQPSNGGTGSS